MKFKIKLQLLKGFWQKRRRVILITTGAAVLILAVGVVSKNFLGNRKGDPTLAVVNGRRIRASDFRRWTASLPEFYQAYVKGNRSQFLQDIIDRELIYQKARHSRYARDKERKERLAELEKDLLVQEFVQKEILENQNVSEKEMRQYFKSHPMDFIQPASVHLYEIMVSDRKTAEAVIDKYRSGESFEDLARKYSEAPSKSVGGELGFVREGKLPQRLDQVAFNLLPNQISSPIQTDAGYYILMARQKIPSRQLEYNEAVPLIKKMMSSKYGEESFKKYIGNLRARSRIKIMEENLEKMEF